MNAFHDKLLLHSQKQSVDLIGLYTLPAAEITIMAYGNIAKVQIHEEKSNSPEKYFSMSLWETNDVLHRKENKFDRLFLFSRVNRSQALLTKGMIDFYVM